jgi:hypothetical protein
VAEDMISMKKIPLPKKREEQERRRRRPGRAGLNDFFDVSH